MEDVEAIQSYIARDSPHYAALLAERIVESVERLKEFPRSGRLVPEVGKEPFREVIFRPYRVVYRLTSEQVDILTVVHAARLLPELVGAEEP